jgi:hypothetical protein
VVLPASGWEMIAKVRRRATSAASGERDGDSVAIARSDMGLSVWQGNRAWIKQDRHASIYGLCGGTPVRGLFAYRSSDTDQYVSAATIAAAGMVITQA